MKYNSPQMQRRLQVLRARRPVVGRSVLAILGSPRAPACRRPTPNQVGSDWAGPLGQPS